jgi:hypothetical protein
VTVDDDRHTSGPATDLGKMTAGELVDWLLARDEAPAPLWLAAFRAAGLTDLAWADHPRVKEAAAELVVLTDHGREPLSELLTPADIDRLCQVGHAVYSLDRENLLEWVALADLIDRSDRTDWTHRLPTYNRRWVGDAETRAFIAGLLVAGRGPTYGRELVQAAAEHHVSPTTYGYDNTITPATFTDLAAAGVSGFGLERCLAEGITIPEVLDFALAGCSAGAIIAAKLAGIPRSEWKELTSGLDPSWFPLADGSFGSPIDPLQRGAIGELGYTWGQLRSLVNHGWGQVPRTRLNRIWYGPRGAVVEPTAVEVVQVAEAGVGYEELIRWLKALTTGGRAKPLLFRNVNLLAQLALIVELRGNKVTPGSLTDYRHCGCTSIEELRAALAAGIDPQRASYLRTSYGGRDKSIRNLQALLTYHRNDTAMPGTGAVTGTNGGLT